MTYNQTLNKLMNLFKSITNEKQIPMAKKYSRMLISRVEVTDRSSEGCIDFSAIQKKNDLVYMMDRLALHVRHNLEDL